MKNYTHILDVSILELAVEKTRVARFVLIDHETGEVVFKYHKDTDSLPMFLEAAWFKEKPVSVYMDKGTAVTYGKHSVFQGVQIVIENAGRTRSKGRIERLIFKIEQDFERRVNLGELVRKGFVELNQLANQFTEEHL